MMTIFVLKCLKEVQKENNCLPMLEHKVVFYRFEKKNKLE